MASRPNLEQTGGGTSEPVQNTCNVNLVSFKDCRIATPVPTENVVSHGAVTLPGNIYPKEAIFATTSEPAPVDHNDLIAGRFPSATDLLHLSGPSTIDELASGFAPEIENGHATDPAPSSPQYEKWQQWLSQLPPGERNRFQNLGQSAPIATPPEHSSSEDAYSGPFRPPHGIPVDGAGSTWSNLPPDVQRFLLQYRPAESDHAIAV